MLSFRAALLSGGSRALPYSYRFTAEGAETDDIYRQNTTNSGVAGTNYIGPSLLAGFACSVTGSCFEVSPDGTLRGAPFGTNTGGYTSEGYVTRSSITNILPRSQEINLWPAPTNATVTSNTDVAPDGTTTMDTITTTANGVGSIGQAPASVAALTTYTTSIFIKPKSFTKAFIQVNRLSGGGAFFACIDLTDGSVGAVQTLVAGFTGVSVGAGVLVGDTYRFPVTFTTPASTTNVTVYVGPTDSLTGRNSTAGATIAAWGGQLITGARAGPYIPTTSGSSTRGESTTAANIFGDASALSRPFVLFAKFRTPHTAASGSVCIFGVDDGTANNRVYLRYAAATGRINRNVVSGGSTINDDTAASGSVNDNAVHKAALRVDASGKLTVFVDGAIALTETGALSTPSGLTRAVHGFGQSSLNLNGVLANAYVLQGAWTDGQLIAQTGV